MTTDGPEVGPGKNGWPAHGFSGTPFMKLRCYCDEEFTSKMALNRHVEAEAVAAERTRIAEAVRDPANWLSSCRCATINPKFGEGQPGGHCADCDWASERDVRGEILAIIEDVP
jgi:hypothetical protein